MAESGKAERWPLWLRLAWLETRGSLAFSVGFVLSLSLGLIGFLLLDAFKHSIQSHLEEGSKGILAADLVVSAPRPLTEAEEAKIKAALPPGSELRREVGMLAMAATASTSRLVELRAIDGKFPFYGDFRLKMAGLLESATPKAVVTEPKTWVHPELLLQMNVKIGDELKIGNTSFQIADVVEQDPAISTSGLSAAPRAYIGLDFVEQTGLVMRGSRVYRSLLVKLPDSGPSADEVVKALKKALGKTELRLSTHRGASEELNRLLIYLNDYLGLVAMVALFLAGLGAAFLFRSFLARRTKDIAILLSLGGSQWLARRVYTAQLLILGFVATLLTVGLTLLLLPVLPRVFGPLLPQGLVLDLPLASLALAFLLGTLGSVLFCLPLLARIGAVKPAALFQEAAAPELNLSARAALAWLPALTAYWGLAVWQAHSLKTGSLFVGLFLGAGLLLGLACYGLMLLLARLGERRSLALDLAILNLTRHRVATLASFLAISLGALLLNLVPEIRTVVTRELDQPPGERLPSLFLIDIQDEQVEPLTAKLKELGSELKFISPMVRARLSGINGKDTLTDEPGMKAAETREEEQESRMQNRGYNLSYRTGLQSSEELVAGRVFSGRYRPDAGKTPEISLETGFAERLGLKLGDKLRFDVQGVDVEGEVISTRRVRWTSFQPNFFVQFQPGVLDDAPKTWIAAIPDLPLEVKVKTQAALVAAFPNVSIIDVSAAVERILGIIAQISIAMAFMAALTLLAGIAVLFSIARHQAEQRITDTTLLKVLGADFASLRRMTLWEFGLLGLSAAGLGGAISIAVSYVLSHELFESAWVFAWETPLIAAFATTLLCLVTGMAATARVLRTKPLMLLNATRP